MNSLRLHFRVEDQRHGELTAFVRCNEFSGRGSAWSFPNQIREFLTAIGAFPIETNNGPKLEGGFMTNLVKHYSGATSACSSRQMTHSAR